MEEISVKGEKYIKAAVIADKFGYTSDYVGQLCRSRQVKATLVGRSWYVSEKSLSEHKRSRYRSTLAKSRESVRKLAEERLDTGSPRFMQRIASYETDEGDLIPVVIKSPVSDIHAKSPEAMTGKSAPNTDNKPLNKASFRLSEKYSTEVKKPLPQVRIISSRAAAASSLHPRTVEAKPAADLPSFRPRRWVTAAAALFFMIAAAGIFTAFTGLEKRVVTIEEGSEVILYNFDLEPLKKVVAERL